jgi:hypothetical protein
MSATTEATMSSEICAGLGLRNAALPGKFITHAAIEA